MAVVCRLCPKHCVLEHGQSGECRIRINLGGTLLAVTYGHPVAVHVDPMEKKPLYHFLPGTPILSLATVGCNLHCKNCQNWEISQADPEATASYRLSPSDVIATAVQASCPSIAYTYTEPLVAYEYTLAMSEAARAAGLRNVLVTAGYCEPEPLRRLFAVTDAANIDLKAMSDRFYQEICGATLRPVLAALELARSMSVHLEVTNLLLPGLNDGEREVAALAVWIREHLGPTTPLHFSRFHPHYRLRDLPPTPASSLLRARELARDAGLHHVYLGNLDAPEGGTTSCPGCGGVLLRRRGFQVVLNRLVAGACPDCGRALEGLWIVAPS